MLPDALFWNVHMYGILIAVGILAAFAVLFLYAKRKGLDPIFTDFVFYTAIGAIVFGFFAAALFQATYNYIENPRAGFSLGGGITFIGGLIGGTLFFLAVYFLLGRRRGVSLLAIVTLAPCMITVAHAFGRVGCFFAGCCYGKQTDSVLGVKFPALRHEVLPTQLWEAIFLFLLFGLCSYLYLKKDFRHNMSVYLIGYGAWRFGLEFLRDDARGKLLGALSPSQFWSLVMIAAGVGLYVLLRHLSRSQTKTENV
ncbi:MAG: prolipoprotein diacylglyceryl transferase [Clostridia bacterium]|nr:prolipoprotein diacylglyceryl transferase [Clostridia bacterium]